MLFQIEFPFKKVALSAKEANRKFPSVVTMIPLCQGLYQQLELHTKAKLKPVKKFWATWSEPSIRIGMSITEGVGPEHYLERNSSI